MSIAIPAIDEKRWTAEAYFAWADDNDDTRYEVLEGKLIMMAAPEITYQRITGNIYSELRYFVRRNKLGEVLFAPVDVVLGDNVVEPDVLFVSKERKSIIGRKRITGAPDLVVEVLSVSTAKRDLREKWSLYERSGVQEYWVVTPTGMVEVLKLIDGKYETHCEVDEDGIVTSNLFEGFSLEASLIFE